MEKSKDLVTQVGDMSREDPGPHKESIKQHQSFEILCHRKMGAYPNKGGQGQSSYILF